MARRPSRPDPSESVPPTAPYESGGSGAGDAPGLGEQLGRTRRAFSGLITSHIRLLRAEMSEIMDEVKQALAVVAAAAALLLVAAVLLTAGTLLWLGVWVFGSMGWGVLLGSTFLIAVAVVAVLAIFPGSGPRLGMAFGVSLVVAVAAGVLSGLQIKSRMWGWVGDSFFGGLAWPDGNAISAADRPIVVAVLVVALLAGVIGLLIGLAAGEGIGGRLSDGFWGALFGAGLGALLGGLSGVPMSWGIAVAVGLAVFLILLPILAPILVLPHVDWDELKDRLTPNETIETTKETIEWVREQMPLGRKS